MALVDGYSPSRGDKYLDLYVYAVRHLGPGPETKRLSGEQKGTKLGRKATHVRHLLRELAVYADWNTGGRCHPDQERLANALAVQRSTVSATLQDAIAVGWLLKAPRKPRGRDWALSHYQLVLPPGIREEAEAHARGRRESGQPEGEPTRDDPWITEDGRLESRRAPEDGRRVSEDGRLENGGGRLESRHGVVGKADTNPSVNPSVEPLKRTSARAREDLGSADRDVPKHFDPAEHGLEDPVALFKVLSQPSRTNPSAIPAMLYANACLVERKLLLRGAQCTALDLSMLTAEEYRALAWMVATPIQRRGVVGT